MRASTLFRTEPGFEASVKPGLLTPNRAGPGYERAGSFAGYAAAFLPGRLTSAWHELHPEHTCAQRPDDRRVWRYGHAPEFFEQLAQEREHELMTAQPVVVPARHAAPPRGQLSLF